jgi:hypothetical protein
MRQYVRELTTQSSIRLVVSVLALGCSLVGCDLNALDDSSYVIFQMECANGQLEDKCRVRPVETIAVTVSLDAQKVVWKRRPLDGGETYEIGTHCIVIGSADFNCDQLTKDRGQLELADAQSFPEEFSPKAYVDNHLISWILWLSSNQNGSSTLSVGTYTLLNNSFMSVVIVIAAPLGVLAAIGMFVALRNDFNEFRRRPRGESRNVAKEQSNPFASSDKQEKKRRKSLGYD